MKIGYLMQNGAPDMGTVSGPQLHVNAIVTGLQKRGHHVRLVAIQNRHIGVSDDFQHWVPARFGFSREKSYQLLESALRRFQTGLHLPYFCFFDSLRFADAAYHALRDFDILYERHGYLAYGGIFLAHWLKKPIVIEMNGNILSEIDARNLKISRLQRSIGIAITKKTLTAADHIIAVSNALKRELISMYTSDEKHISVVPNGVDIELFSRPSDPEKTRQTYQLDYRPTVIFVGIFEPWHGVDMLVSSFAEVMKRIPDAQLILVGDGPTRSTLQDQIANQGLTTSVKMLGRLPQSQVAAVLGVADIAVAPYPYTSDNIVGTPLKLVEYMAAGKAVVASTASIHELIEDGVNGIRVAPANTHALADGICLLLENKNLRMTIAENARLHAQHNYSWDCAVQKIETIFSKLTNG